MSPLPALAVLASCALLGGEAAAEHAVGSRAETYHPTTRQVGPFELLGGGDVQAAAVHCAANWGLYLDPLPPDALEITLEVREITPRHLGQCGYAVDEELFEYAMERYWIQYGLSHAEQNAISALEEAPPAEPAEPVETPLEAEVRGAIAEGKRIPVHLACPAGLPHAQECSDGWREAEQYRNLMRDAVFFAAVFLVALVASLITYGVWGRK